MSTWLVDPDTGDYVMEGGSPVIDNTLKTPAYIRLKAHRNGWLYAPNSTYGSDFYREQRKHTLNTPEAMRNIALRALQPLIDEGRADEITVTAESNGRYAVILNVRILETSGIVTTLEFNPLGV